MKLGELAKIFKMTVTEFSEEVGYSRQALYLLFERKEAKGIRRFGAFIKHLEVLSEKYYADDLAKAKIQKQEREQVLEYLRGFMNDK